jgi:hypothetical protein
MRLPISPVAQKQCHSAYSGMSSDGGTSSGRDVIEGVYMKDTSGIGTDCDYCLVRDEW